MIEQNRAMEGGFQDVEVSQGREDAGSTVAEITGEAVGEIWMVRGEALGCQGRLQKNVIAKVQGRLQFFGHVFIDGSFAIFHFGNMPLGNAGF